MGVSKVVLITHPHHQSDMGESSLLGRNQLERRIRSFGSEDFGRSLVVCSSAPFAEEAGRTLASRFSRIGHVVWSELLEVRSGARPEDEGRFKKMCLRMDSLLASPRGPDTVFVLCGLAAMEHLLPFVAGRLKASMNARPGGSIHPCSAAIIGKGRMTLFSSVSSLAPEGGQKQAQMSV